MQGFFFQIFVVCGFLFCFGFLKFKCNYFEFSHVDLGELFSTDQGKPQMISEHSFHIELVGQWQWMQCIISNSVFTCICNSRDDTFKNKLSTYCFFLCQTTGKLKSMAPGNLLSLRQINGLGQQSKLIKKKLW